MKKKQEKITIELILFYIFRVFCSLVHFLFLSQLFSGTKFWSSVKSYVCIVGMSFFSSSSSFLLFFFSHHAHNRETEKYLWWCGKFDEQKKFIKSIVWWVKLFNFSKIKLCKVEFHVNHPSTWWLTIYSLKNFVNKQRREKREWDAYLCKKKKRRKRRAWYECLQNSLAFIIIIIIISIVVLCCLLLFTWVCLWRDSFVRSYYESFTLNNDKSWNILLAFILSSLRKKWREKKKEKYSANFCNYCKS